MPFALDWTVEIVLNRNLVYLKRGAALQSMAAGLQKQQEKNYKKYHRKNKEEIGFKGRRLPLTVFALLLGPSQARGHIDCSGFAHGYIGRCSAPYRCEV